MISTAESWHHLDSDGEAGGRRRGGRRRGEEGGPGSGSKAIFARGPQSTMGMSYLFVQ